MARRHAESGNRRRSVVGTIGKRIWQLGTFPFKLSLGGPKRRLVSLGVAIGLGGGYGIHKIGGWKDIDRFIEYVKGVDVTEIEPKVRIKQPAKANAAKAKNNIAFYRKLLKQVPFKHKHLVYKMIAVELAPVYGINPKLALALMRTESNFNPRATSKVGACGLMQIMPRTEKNEIAKLKMRQVVKGKHSLYEPVYNIDGGLAYLRYLINLMRKNTKSPKYNETHFTRWGIAAYNAGYKGVITRKYIRAGASYLRKVLGNYKRYREVDSSFYRVKLQSLYPKLFGFRKVASWKPATRPTTQTIR